MAIETKYRTLWRRLCASILDLLMIFPVFGLNDALLDSRLSLRTKAVLFIATSMLSPAYTVGMHWRFGATLGEQALGLRVVDLSEKPLTFRQALARSAIALIEGGYSCALTASMILAGHTITWKTMAAMDTGTIHEWVGRATAVIEIAVVLLSAKRRSLSDFIAGTVIVRETLLLRSTPQLPSVPLA